jgi:hypothetical protein
MLVLEIILPPGNNKISILCLIIYENNGIRFDG